MSTDAICPECGGYSAYAGSDQRGAIYTCQSVDGACPVFDHWDDEVRTYQTTYRGSYRALDDDED